MKRFKPEIVDRAYVREKTGLTNRQILDAVMDGFLRSIDLWGEVWNREHIDEFAKKIRE